MDIMREEILYYDKTQVSHYARNDYTKILAFLNENGSYDLILIDIKGNQTKTPLIIKK